MSETEKTLVSTMEPNCRRIFAGIKSCVEVYILGDWDFNVFG